MAVKDKRVLVWDGRIDGTFDCTRTVAKTTKAFQKPVENNEIRVGLCPPAPLTVGKDVCPTCNRPVGVLASSSQPPSSYLGSVLWTPGVSVRVVSTTGSFTPGAGF